MRLRKVVYHWIPSQVSVVKHILDPTRKNRALCKERIKRKSIRRRSGGFHLLSITPYHSCVAGKPNTQIIPELSIVPPATKSETKRRNPIPNDTTPAFAIYRRSDTSSSGLSSRGAGFSCSAGISAHHPVCNWQWTSGHW